MGTGSNLMNWVVTCQWRGSTDFFENFGKMVNMGRVHWTHITAILPNHFELPLFRVFDLQMLRIRGLLMVGCPKWIVPDWCSYFVMILNFCIDRPFQVSTYQDNYYYFFFFSIILPGPPFRVFSPPRRSFLPKPLFKIFDLSSFFDRVFLDCTDIHRMCEFVTIHSCKSIAHELL